MAWRVTRRDVARIGVLTIAGLVGFLWLWNIVGVHPGFDTLMYLTFALEFTGQPLSQATDGAWQQFVQHASHAAVQVHADAWPWQGFDDPARDRWEGIYRMRPLYPLAIAALYPALGLVASVGVAVLTVIGITLVLGLGLPGLVGIPVTAVVILLSYINPFLRPLAGGPADGWARTGLSSRRPSRRRAVRGQWPAPFDRPRAVRGHSLGVHSPVGGIASRRVRHLRPDHAPVHPPGRRSRVHGRGRYRCPAGDLRRLHDGGGTPELCRHAAGYSNGSLHPTDVTSPCTSSRFRIVGNCPHSSAASSPTLLS